jgi:translation initiation factor 2 subunit 2
MEEVQLINFTGLLKKRTKKNGGVGALNLDNINLLSGKKQESATTSGPQQNKDDANTEYDYDFLYERICNLIKKNNPSVTEKTKISLKAPDVRKVTGIKCVWVNFNDTCISLNREKEHFLNFILMELGTDGSIGGDYQLNLKGRYNNKHIESLLKKYVQEYVTCKNCNSPNTILIKDNSARIQILRCNNCNSERTVTQVKTTKVQKK